MPSENTLDIYPNRSPEEDAYADFVGKVETFASGMCVTEKQEQDLYDTVLFRPISSWQIFKAGWDAAIAMKS
jgi:hypothetical protein